MDDDGDDFTFPTVAAAARGATAPERPQLGRGDDAVPLLLQLPAALPNSLAAGVSPLPLWPFAGESVPKTTTTSLPPPVTAADDEQALVPPLSGSSSGQQDGVDGHRVAADDDRMDLLWEATRTRAPTAAADVDDDKQRAAALADAERMDKLWESFNDDLVVLRHRARTRDRRAKSAAAGSRVVPRAAAGGPDHDPHPADDDDDRWYLCNYSPPPSSGESDDQEDQEMTSASSPAEQRRGYGCAPTMLRASSRAGGAGQFCGGASPRARRRHGRRGWALLLRLFRRLFAVETTTAPSSSSRSLYVP